MPAGTQSHAPTPPPQADGGNLSRGPSTHRSFTRYNYGGPLCARHKLALETQGRTHEIVHAFIRDGFHHVSFLERPLHE